MNDRYPLRTMKSLSAPDGAATVDATPLHHCIREARQSWSSKSALRAVYNDYYGKVLLEFGRGRRILEIGAGSGHSLKALRDEDVTRLGILAAPWIDVVADAHLLPMPGGSFDAIMMVDVLHHLQDPPQFFAEVVRLLRPRGRCVMVEPAITPIAGIFLENFFTKSL